MDKVTIELTIAERDFLLAVVDAGFAAMGISTLIGKLRATREPAPAPVETVEPAPEGTNDVPAFA